jgi:hypothetical protein
MITSVLGAEEIRSENQHAHKLAPWLFFIVRRAVDEARIRLWSYPRYLIRVELELLILPTLNLMTVCRVW